MEEDKMMKEDKLKQCEDNCKDYHEIPYDFGVMDYCAKFDSVIDDEIIRKCNELPEFNK